MTAPRSAKSYENEIDLLRQQLQAERDECIAYIKKLDRYDYPSRKFKSYGNYADYQKYLK